MKDINAPRVPLRLPKARQLLSHINKTFGTLAFCRRWLERPDGGSTTINGVSGKQVKYYSYMDSYQVRRSMTGEETSNPTSYE